MKDGGDFQGNANGCSVCGMCDRIAIQANYSMKPCIPASCRSRRDRGRHALKCMTVDSGIGVVRAPGRYSTAKDVANGEGKLTDERIKIPLWWEPAHKVTFGPAE